MRPTAPVLVSGACALALLLAPPVEAAGDASLSSGANATHVQVLGWSKDEQRIAFQVYSWLNGTYEAHELSESIPDDGDESMPGPGRPCRGYVNHKGKPFQGSLSVPVFERGTRVAGTWILDDIYCTPPEEAEQLRSQAKQMLVEQGIDSRRPGHAFVLKPRGMRMEVKAGRRVPYVLEYVNTTRLKPEAQEGSSRFRGALRLFLRKGSTRRMVFEKEFNTRYSSDSGSGYAVTLSHVFVSPSGERLVVVAHERAENMRGTDEETWVTGVVDLASGVTVKGRGPREKTQEAGTPETDVKADAPAAEAK
jgi:predicted secreted protein